MSEALARYSEKARQVLLSARHEAAESGNSFVDCDHLILGIMAQSAELLSAFLEPSEQTDIADRIRKHIKGEEEASSPVETDLTDSVREALRYADQESRRLESDLVEARHILAGVLQQEESFGVWLLRRKGVTPQKADRSPVAEVLETGTQVAACEGSDAGISGRGHAVALALAMLALVLSLGLRVAKLSHQNTKHPLNQPKLGEQATS
jgi:ATP-dependent Clp protease ATP-binding subunit ClpA